MPASQASIGFDRGVSGIIGSCLDSARGRYSRVPGSRIVVQRDEYEAARTSGAMRHESLRLAPEHYG
ncbi:hypothetical protein GCM10010470_57270 [Saccharopolyspora taberi]|uniref:Uncharacterized protein n=1 Tax=Saccharopolyspora taberi TaxID=60895 RepID=A0ABN3VKL8_9PSEU